MNAMLLWAALGFAAGTTVSVEVVTEPADMRRGLQGHAPLNEWEGMLFVYEEPADVKFWMKDVTFPIDIVFVDPAGEVIGVAASAPPCSDLPCAVYEAEHPAAFVLEVRAGWSARHGVAARTRLDIDVPSRRVTAPANARQP